MKKRDVLRYEKVEKVEPEYGVEEEIIAILESSRRRSKERLNGVFNTDALVVFVEWFPSQNRKIRIDT